MKKFIFCILFLVFCMAEGYFIAKESYPIVAILLFVEIVTLDLIFLKVVDTLQILISFYWLPVVIWLTSISYLRDLYFIEASFWILFLTQLPKSSKLFLLLFKQKKMFLTGITLFLIGSLVANVGVEFSGLLFSRLRTDILLPIIIFLVLDFFIRNHIQMKRISFAYGITTGFICMILTLIWLSGKMPYSNSSIYGARLGFILITPIFNSNLEFEPTTLATSFSVTLPFLLGLAINENSVFKRFLLYLSFSSISVLLLFTQGRAGWLSGILGCLVILILNLKKIGKNWLPVFGLVTLLFFTALILRPLISGSYENIALVERMNTLFQPQDDANFTYRIDQFNQRWDVIWANPMGVNLINIYTSSYYVHSIFFALGLGIGIIGLSGFLLMILAVIIKEVQILHDNLLNKSRIYATIGLGCITAWMIGGLAEPAGLIAAWSAITIWLAFFLSYRGACLTNESNKTI